MKEAPAARQPRQSAKPQPAPRAASRQSKADDPGLLLISRKPPRQKFANFEEYMKSHGGVTAPIEGDDEE